METPKELVLRFMDAFVAAWPRRDTERVASFFSEDATYHNIPLEPVRGREAIAATVASFMDWGGEVRVDARNVVAEGSVVVVERVDHFTGSERSLSLPMVGVFEVRDGQITAWRDYFDLGPIKVAMT